MPIRPEHAKLISRGLAAAAFMGAYYLSSRRRIAAPPPRLIHWERVRSIATGIARRGVEPRRYDDLVGPYTDMVLRSHDVIAEYTREPLPLRNDNVHVFDRVEWLDANIAAFRELFEPVEEISLQLGRGGTGMNPFGDLNQLLLSSQMGLLLGYLSRRVLGQYDLALLGKEPVTTGRLYFVEPNIKVLEQRLGLNGPDFRLWIALHETTHAYEFEAHPWVREYMNGLLRRYFATLGEDLANLRSDLVGIASFARRIGSNVRQRGYAVELVMTPEQRDIFRRLQALMCLLEGYSNHVMDEVGRSLLPSYDRMKARFEDRRRQRGAGERLFAKLTGLEVKLEQYVLGERFVNRIVAEVGIDAMNRVWTGPETLPTLDEVRAPELWRRRVIG